MLHFQRKILDVRQLQLRVFYIYMAFYGESPVVVRQWNFMERYSVQSVYKVTKGLKIFNISAMTHLLSKKNISK